MTVANGGRKTSLHLSLPAEAESVSEARHAIASFAADHGASSDDVALAVSEAVSNSVIHGFRGRDPGLVVVSVQPLDDSLAVSVSDDGVGVMPNPDSPGLGLGLALIGSISDKVELSRNGRGTTILMRFPREIARG